MTDEPQQRQRRHGDTGFLFLHRLTRDAAYTALLGQNRRRLHSVAADMLLAQRVRGSVGDHHLIRELWRHLALAGRYEEAHKWCAATIAQAATAADERLITAQTEDLWRLACEQAGDPEAESPHCLGLQASLAERAGRSLEAEALRQRGYEVALALGELDFAARHQATQATRSIWHGKFDEARAHLAQATTLNMELASERLQLRLGYIQSYLLLEEGRAAEALVVIEALIEQARERGDLVWELKARGHEAAALATLGRQVEAAEAWRQFGELALQVGDLRDQCEALFEQGTLDSIAGNHANALKRTRQALALARQRGSAVYIALALTALGRAEIAAGRVANESEAGLREALAIFEHQQREGHAMQTRVLLAMIAVQRGGTAKARTTLAAAEELCQRLPAVAQLMQRELPQLRLLVDCA